MLPESKNIQTIADNIRTLENQINALDVEIPPHASTDSGKVLSVDSDGDLEWRNETPYIPPAYSTEEVNTGHKWIDGKDVYCKIINFEGDPQASSPVTSNVDISNLSIDNIIKIDGLVFGVGSTETIFNIDFYSNNTTFGRISINSVKTSISYRLNFSAGAFKGAMAIIYYTKQTETKTKKGGNKK